RYWSDFILGKEIRDESVGHNSGAYLNGGYNGGSSFVPFEFIQDVYKAYRWYEAFMYPDVVSDIKTNHGRPTVVPLIDDTDQIADVVGETSDQSSSGHNIDRPGGVVLQGYTYRSPLWRLSIEAAQDVATMGGYIELFRNFVSDRIA